MKVVLGISHWWWPVPNMRGRLGLGCVQRRRVGLCALQQDTPPCLGPSCVTVYPVVAAYSHKAVCAALLAGWLLVAAVCVLRAVRVCLLCVPAEGTCHIRLQGPCCLWGGAGTSIVGYDQRCMLVGACACGMPAGIPWKACALMVGSASAPVGCSFLAALGGAPRCNGPGCHVIQQWWVFPAALLRTLCVHVHLPECGCWWSCRQRLLGCVWPGWFHGWCLLV